MIIYIYEKGTLLNKLNYFYEKGTLLNKLNYFRGDFGVLPKKVGVFECGFRISECGISSKLKARKVIGSLISYCVRIAEEDNS